MIGDAWRHAPPIPPFFWGKRQTEEAKEKLADEGEWVQSLDRIGTILTRWFFIHQAKKGEADETGKGVLHDQYEREWRFMIRRMGEPGFAHYVSARLDYTKSNAKKRSGKVVGKRMSMLAEIIIEDIARESSKQFLTANQLVPHTIHQAPGEDTKPPSRTPKYDRFHELVNEFKELLSTSEEAGLAFRGKKFAAGRRVDDRRERVITTPFSSPTGVDKAENTASFIGWLLSRPETRTLGYNVGRFIGEGAAQTAAVGVVEKVADPIEMRKIMAFQADIRSLMAKHHLKLPTITEDSGPGADREAMRFISCVLYDQVRPMIELYWFRGLRQDRQEELIGMKPMPLRPVTKKIARECLSLLREWLGDPHRALFTAMGAAQSLRLLSMPSSAENLILEAPESLDIGKVDRAYCLHALAISRSWDGKPDEPVKTMKVAIKQWDLDVETAWGAAIEYAYLAELALREMKGVEYEDFKRKAETIAFDSRFTPRQRATATLWVADCAEEFSDVSWEGRVLERGLRITVKEPELLNFFEYFDYSLNELRLRGCRPRNLGEGMVPKPRTRPEEISGVLLALAGRIDQMTQFQNRMRSRMSP